jgi:CRP/FNR family transcriptional regulator, cyclic AMP receptor protein
MLEPFAGVAAEMIRPLGTTRGLLISVASLVGLTLIVAASFVRTMVPLRTLTLVSNLFLVLAASLAPNPVSILLYCVLIPLNTYRLVEIRRLTRKVTAASRAGDLSGVWLRPYMKPHRLRAGTVLFRRGDVADELYLLLEGELQLAEIGKLQPAGELFGEISMFAPDRTRTLTAQCVTDCLVLGIGEEAFRRLYFQNPRFAFQVSTLIAHRLGADVARVRTQADRLQRRCETLESELAAVRGPRRSSGT